MVQEKAQVNTIAVKCLHISDTHQEDIFKIVSSFLSETDIKQVDLLFISGDLTYRGDIDKLKKCAEECEQLILENYVKDIVVIPGNHDKSFDPKFKKSEWFSPRVAKSQFEKDHIHLLIHKEIELHGIKIFGSPWTPYFCNWAFNYYEDRAYDLWKMIPEDCQILVTHGPPQFILDEVHDWDKIKYTGCPVLAAEIRKRQSLRVSMFGHIHEGYGQKELNGVLYLNSSIMNRRYYPTNKPQYFEFN